MKIDLTLLMSALNECKEEKTFTPTPVSEYVLTHILGPFQRNEPINFAELNYDAFDDTDLNELEDWCAEQEHSLARLRNLNMFFCEAIPVSAVKRAFC